MEIHPPHRAITSIKSFLAELLTITVGILIALSLEGLVDWHHHRELAQEAKSNITSELRENQREIEKETQDLQKGSQQIQSLVGLVHQLQQNRKTKISNVQYGMTIAELHSTSWDTARTTGALSYMPYPEVKKYTEVYDLQREFGALQQRAIAASLDVQAMTTLLGRATTSLTTTELSSAETRLGTVLADVTAMQQIAEPLKQRYESVLSDQARE